MHTQKTLGYMGRKTYVTAARGPAKERKTREGQKEKQTHKKNQSSPLRRREEPMG